MISAAKIKSIVSDPGQTPPGQLPPGQMPLFLATWVKRPSAEMPYAVKSPLGQMPPPPVQTVTD